MAAEPRPAQGHPARAGPGRKEHLLSADSGGSLSPNSLMRLGHGFNFPNGCALCHKSPTTAQTICQLFCGAISRTDCNVACCLATKNRRKQETLPLLLSTSALCGQHHSQAVAKGIGDRFSDDDAPRNAVVEKIVADDHKMIVFNPPFYHRGESSFVAIGFTCSSAA